jgi:hypothetical protein
MDQKNPLNYPINQGFYLCFFLINSFFLKNKSKTRIKFRNFTKAYSELRKFGTQIRHFGSGINSGL